MSNLRIALLLLIFSGPGIIPAIAQEEQEATMPDPRMLDEYKENASYLVSVVEQYFNIVGDSSSSFRDKSTIISDSWRKLFRDEKVQVQDDLDPFRKHIIYKNITAYLKDIDFFFRHAHFDFELKEIQPLLNDAGDLFLKVDLHQKLNAIDIDGDTVSREGERYLEIFVNQEEQDLKIVSIYSDKIDEEINLLQWWSNLDKNWQLFFARQITLRDSINLEQIIAEKDSIDFAIDALWIGAPKDTADTPDTLYFKDAEIFSQLRSITVSESLSLNEDSTLQSLDALQPFSNLRRLDISHTHIQDLSAIRHFTDLRYLNAAYSLVHDINPLKYNSGLKFLDLSFTLVEELEGLERFINLEYLNLSNTRPEDLKGLENLTALKELKLSNMVLTQKDYNRLKYLKGLDYLKLSYSNIEDLTPVSALDKLTRLDIRSTHITDITPLSGCKQLKIVNLEGAPLSSLLPLLVLPNIEKIYCDNTRISKKQAYDFMSKKTGTLVIHNSQYLIQWWNSLTEEWKKILSPEWVNNAPDKETLQEIASQTKIDISSNDAVTSIEAVKILENLTYLDISHTNVGDIDPLSELRNLKYLDCSHTPVSSLTPLILCSKLELLKMEATPIRFLEPLNALDKLKAVYADSSEITQEEVDSLVIENAALTVVHRTDYYRDWWERLSDDWKYILTDRLAIPVNPGKLQLHQIVLQRKIEIENNRKLTYLEPLKKLRYLRQLKVSQTGISDLEPLSKLVYLDSLSFTDSPLENIAPLKKLYKLQYLNLSNTPVRDLDALEGLPNLKSLVISGTDIKNLRSLSDLTSLEMLDCSNTDVRNLRHIEELPQLKSVVCYNTRISERYIQDFKAVYQGVKVVHY